MSDETKEKRASLEALAWGAAAALPAIATGGAALAVAALASGGAALGPYLGDIWAKR